VPSHLRAARRGSRISAAHFPHGRRRTPLYWITFRPLPLRLPAPRPRPPPLTLARAPEHPASSLSLLDPATSSQQPAAAHPAAPHLAHATGAAGASTAAASGSNAAVSPDTTEMSARRKREFSCSVFGSWNPPRSSLGAAMVVLGWWLCECDLRRRRVGRCREREWRKGWFRGRSDG
jgi:hypothetical protein